MGQIVFQATLGGQVAVAGPNTASSFTLTLPAATDTLVGKATTDTLTNKTLTSPTITGATLTTSAFNGTVGATTASTGAFTTLSTSSTTTLSGLTASTALALDASKNVVSVTNTGTGNNVLSASPTLTGTIAGASLSLSSLTSGRVTYATTSGLLTDSATLTYDGTTLTATTGANFCTTSGLVGIGITTVGSSAGVFSQLQIGGTSTANSRVIFYGQKNASAGGIVSNGYYDASNNLVYSQTYGVSQLYLDNGTFVFNNAASGTSGTNVTATERMRIDSSGRLLVGYTSNQGTGSLQVNGFGRISNFDFGNTADNITYVGGNVFGIGTVYGLAMFFKTSGTERMRISDAGLVGIGTSSPSSLLQVGVGSPRETTASFFGTGNNISSSVGTVGIYSTDTTGANVGPSIALGGQTGNAANPYPFGFIQGAKNSATAGDYGGYLRFLTIPSNGGSPVQNLVLNTGGGITALSTIGVGSVTPSASGAGITFPATQSASSDANTLDDYEEGTWTPTVYGATTAGTTTYSQQRGFYTKIGRVVNLTFDVGYTAATGTGNLYIGGLPFTASALGNSAQYTGSVMTNNLNMPNAGSYASYINGGSPQLEFYSSTDDATLQAVALSNETATIWASITYFV